MLHLRSLAASTLLVLLIAALAACLPGCGGGDFTTEEIAQIDSDRQASAALDARKTIQPVNCANSACK